MEKEKSKKKPAPIRHLDLPPKPGNGKSPTSTSSPDPFQTTYEKNEIPVLDPPPLSSSPPPPLSSSPPPPLPPGSPLPLSPSSPPPQLLVLEQHEVLPIPEGRDNSNQQVLHLAIDYYERLEPACDLSPPSSPNHLEFHLEEWLYLYMHPVDVTEPMFVSGYETISAYRNNTKFITNTQ